MFSREAVGVVSILLHAFQWKSIGNPMLVHFSMFQICN